MKKILYTILFFVNTLSACAVCYGAPDDPVSKSLNYSIIVLLGFIGTVLLGLILSILSIRNKNKAIAND